MTDTEGPCRQKKFTAEEKKIRSEYLRKRAKQMPAKNADNAIEQMRQVFVAMGKKDEKA